MKLAIIGVDGASWSILKWLMDKDHVPKLKQIVEKGVHGLLESVIPPVTGAAWLSMATGLNPGKTGVVDFLKNTGDFILKPVSSTDYQGISIWDYLSALNYRVAVLDYPMLYPAYPINGVMVSSWGGKLSTYPEALAEEIEKLVGGRYRVFVNYHLRKYNDIDLFLEDLDKAIKVKLKVSRYLMGKEWNLFIDVFSFTDWLQHRMWHYIDPSHPLHPGRRISEKYVKRFAEFWQILDEYIGEVSEVYDDILIVSDHGFGPQWGVFNLSKWLIKHGFVKPRRCIRLRAFIIRVIRRYNIHKIFDIIPLKFFKSMRGRELSTLNPNTLYDLKDGKVVVPNYTIPFGAIHVNPKVKESYEEVLEEIIYMLHKLSDEVGRELKVHVWKVKDLYHGDRVDLLPDLIFTVNDWSCVIVKDPSKNFIYMDAPYSPRHTGSHRLYGVFIAKGASFKKGVRVDKISILDIAPTVLYMFNAPIPSHMDGRVLRSILVYGDGREPVFTSPLYYRVKLLGKDFKRLRNT